MYRERVQNRGISCLKFAIEVAAPLGHKFGIYILWLCFWKLACEDFMKINDKDFFLPRRRFFQREEKYRFRKKGVTIGRHFIISFGSSRGPITNLIHPLLPNKHKFTLYETWRQILTHTHSFKSHSATPGDWHPVTLGRGPTYFLKRANDVAFKFLWYGLSRECSF